jgi:hypothetical protein
MVFHGASPFSGTVSAPLSICQTHAQGKKFHKNMNPSKKSRAARAFTPLLHGFWGE